MRKRFYSSDVHEYNSFLLHPDRYRIQVNKITVKINLTSKMLKLRNWNQSLPVRPKPR